MGRVTRSPLIVVLLAFALAACAGGSGGEDGPAAPTPAVNATTADLLPTDAAALPQFDASRFDSLLRELRGTPVLVNVWGSWCGPCRDEASTLAAAHHRYGHDVQFVGVDILDARGSARGHGE